MYKTITLGSCVAVQGKFVEALQNGKIAVRVGSQTFVGRPVQSETKLEEAIA